MKTRKLFWLALFFIPAIAYAANVGLSGQAIYVPTVTNAKEQTCTAAIEALVICDDEANTIKVCRNTTGVTYAWETFSIAGSCAAFGEACTVASDCCDEGTGATCPSSACCLPLKSTGATGCGSASDCCSGVATCSGGECCLDRGVSGCSSASDCCSGSDACTGGKCCSNTGGSCSSASDCCDGAETCTGGLCTASGGCDTAVMCGSIMDCDPACVSCSFGQCSNF